jgi:hypothetical protein
VAGVFRDLKDDVKGKGLVSEMQFYTREGIGLLYGAFEEHWREGLTRRFSVRNEFRFPQATWILMTIILGGVISAIEKGEAIGASVPHISEPAGPIHPGDHSLLAGIVCSFLLIYALGLLAWAVLFVLRRSDLS